MLTTGEENPGLGEKTGKLGTVARHDSNDLLRQPRIEIKRGGEGSSELGSMHQERDRLGSGHMRDGQCSPAWSGWVVAILTRCKRTGVYALSGFGLSRPVQPAVFVAPQSLSFCRRSGGRYRTVRIKMS